jgi:hypothetical protein
MIVAAVLSAVQPGRQEPRGGAARYVLSPQHVHKLFETHLP